MNIDVKFVSRCGDVKAFSPVLILSEEKNETDSVEVNFFFQGFDFAAIVCIYSSTRIFYNNSVITCDSGIT